MRSLAGETICNVITTQCCASIETIQDPSFSIVDNVFTVAIHTGVDKLLIQNFDQWLQFDALIQTLVEKVVGNPSTTTAVFAFFMLCVTNAIKYNLKSESKVTKNIPSSPDFPLSSCFLEFKLNFQRHTPTPQAP